MLDTITHMSCIGLRIQKRSPLVQSGESNHPANIIAGETNIVKTHNITLNACIASLSHFDSASVAFHAAVVADFTPAAAAASIC